MRFVDENGLPVGELERRARTTTNLAGMQRRGYITIEKDPADLHSQCVETGKAETERDTLEVQNK